MRPDRAVVVAVDDVVGVEPPEEIAAGELAAAVVADPELAA